MIDYTGAIVWRATYSAFGEATVSTNSIAENNLRFPGQYFDEETGLHQNYHRDYDPTLGRYIQSDPIGLEGGINRYGYVYQNPKSYFDPHGRIPIVPAVVIAVRVYCSRNPVHCAAMATAVAQAVAQAVQAVWDVAQQMCRDNDAEEVDCDEIRQDCYDALGGYYVLSKYPPPEQDRLLRDCIKGRAPECL